MDALTNLYDKLHETGPPLLLTTEEFVLCESTLDLAQGQNCKQDKFEEAFLRFVELANQADKETLEYLIRELTNKHEAGNVLKTMARIGLNITAEYAIKARLPGGTT